ncbi:alpha/beta hydrolase family protein [Leptospira inadai serovar Lyme str. 10]|uniref:Alpha/beta hydrolase family protein n=2 Tax=Leptospira inadai serovar Lyme TaxID=293084 RepID=V6HDI5_9LEPT|nr:alpha/beta fold hydrolase [Leptospira inadai]EQA37917.1 alpha/beta hydrolase family protein [Leptospira inadai serovar Lyme str. 10]PNV75099.1 alpha/beta hydrolase [Leptospira inadai serovar Lyme]
MKKDHLTYFPENRSVRPVIIQHLAESYYNFYYLVSNIIGIFVTLPDHTEGDKRPVVLVTGFLGRNITWKAMRDRLVSLGHPVYAVPLGFQTGDIRKKSKLLENFILEKGIKDCYIVGHSMGGLIAAGLSYKGRDRVRKIFTMGSPLHGTYMAYTAPIFPCTWQMVPGSKLVREVVETYSTFHNVQAIFTRGDSIVRPWQSARLGHFDDVEIPEYGHLNLYLGPLGIECLSSLITAEEKKDPLPIKHKSVKQASESVVLASPKKAKSKKTSQAAKKNSSSKKAGAAKKKTAGKKSAKPKKKR